jgi:far upstream element-binding protein
MAENNEVTSEVAKRERPEDAEESTDEPLTKQAKVDLKAEEAEAAPVESENTAASNGTDEAKPEGAASAKDEAKDDTKTDSKSGAEEEKLAPAAATTETQASTPAVAHRAPVPAPAGVPAPTQQSYPPAVVNQAPVPTPVPAGVPVPTQQSYPLAGADTQVVEERGEVSALYVGRVIGKGGEMIRDLQARSACRIDVDQNVPPGQPRVITYRGTRTTVDFAKRLVHMLCQDNASDADLPLGEAKREYLVVPAQSVGKIIGRGGEVRTYGVSFTAFSTIIF